MKNKKENNDNQEERLSWLEVFKRNYKYVPGFKEIFKLSVYIILVVTLAIVMTTTINSNHKRNRNNTVTTTTKAVIRYQDILDKLLDNSKYTATITINDSFYVLNGVFGNSILTGTLEYASGTYSYIIKNDNIYELQGEEQVLNNELLKDIDKDIIMNDSLIKILKGNSGIKIEEEGKTIYKYNNIVINGITYTGEVSVINNNISNINLISDTHKYKFNYNNQ
jgi:hypothetical protein